LKNYIYNYLFKHDNKINVKVLTKQQKTTKTKAFQNPIFPDRNSLKLERHGMKQNIFYIQFTYTYTKNLISKFFYFNASMNSDDKSGKK
jgi:hypothetical protein